jgi:NAD(P)-dependent dehydrogenase (short-subunit alcohol dehydrogenase family)
MMSKKKVWFVTGASRGMGADFARAALAAGHAVVASGRDTARVSKALGQSDDLLPVKLDVTSGADADAAHVHRSGGSQHVRTIVRQPAVRVRQVVRIVSEGGGRTRAPRC